MVRLKSAFIFGFLALSTTACSIDASLLNQLTQTPSITETLESRKEPDFMDGEVVTTTNSYQIRATFGEIGDTQEIVPNAGTPSYKYTFEGAIVAQ